MTASTTTRASPTSGPASTRPGPHRRAPRTRRRPSSTRRARSTSATASRCSSTRAPSSRTAATPTPCSRGCRPTASSPAGARSTADPRSSSPTTRPSRRAPGVARTVEKIVRATEMALREELPVFWFVDSAGARITDQVEMFPGRRGAGRIFHNQVALSGKVPQICCLFGPSAAGGAYIPSFCDLIIMVEGNASMYLGSPRMAEMVVGEKVTLEEMGGARMHCTVSGVGDLLAHDDAEAIELAKLYFSYVPGTWRDHPPTLCRRGAVDAADGAHRARARVRALRHPRRHRRPRRRGLLLRAQAALGRRARHRLRPHRTARRVGIVANNSVVKGGVLFTDSADKAARFIWLCDAFSIPLLYLADVPGFMIGSEVERGGIIRHGAKMVSAVVVGDRAAVLRRRAQGLRRRPLRHGRPGLRPRRHHRAADGPHRRHGAGGRRQRRLRQQDRRDRAAEQGAEARDAFVAERRREYEQDVDIERLAADLVLDCRSSRRMSCARSSPAGWLMLPGVTVTSASADAPSRRSEPRLGHRLEHPDRGGRGGPARSGAASRSGSRSRSTRISRIWVLVAGILLARNQIALPIGTASDPHLLPVAGRPRLPRRR